MAKSGGPNKQSRFIYERTLNDYLLVWFPIILKNLEQNYY